MQKPYKYLNENKKELKNSFSFYLDQFDGGFGMTE